MLAGFVAGAVLLWCSLVVGLGYLCLNRAEGKTDA